MSTNEIFTQIKKEYERKENEIDGELKKIEKQLQRFKSVNVIPSAKSENATNLTSLTKNLMTLEDVKQRNKEIIKEISIAKARLRSRAIYNPAEVTWCSIMQNYKNEPSLPGIEWQCCVHLTSSSNNKNIFNNFITEYKT